MKPSKNLFLRIFQFGGNLDFQDFRMKKFHNIEIFFNATNIAVKIVEKLHSGGENFESESILSRKQSRLEQNFFNSIHFCRFNLEPSKA